VVTCRAWNYGLLCSCTSRRRMWDWNWRTRNMHIATLNLSTTPSLRPRSILISLHVYVNVTIRKVREYAFWALQTIQRRNADRWLTSGILRRLHHHDTRICRTFRTGLRRTTSLRRSRSCFVCLCKCIRH